MKLIPSLIFLAAGLGASLNAQAAGLAVFNVKDFGATGQRADDARPAIQKAMDACAAAGGGIVYLPPGEYTSGVLHLRSNLRVELEAGATLYASTNRLEYDSGVDDGQLALFFGERLENVTLGGRGTVDGQAAYEWREDDFERAFKHKTLMQELGKPLLRSVPRGFPTRPTFPHLVWLGSSTNVHVTGLQFLRSPSWTLTFYACERVVLDRLYLYTSLQEAVWADGVDFNGCRDVAIANCTMETGDDCVAIFANDWWGPARPSEDIRITNCRFSTASAGVKFTEGNQAGIHRVLVSNCVLANVNRGFVFLTIGGALTDIVLSDLVIHCNRFDWFWAGDGQPFFFRVARRSELFDEPPQPGEPPPGAVRNVSIRNVLAHAKGTSLFHGHRERPLEGVRLDGVRFFLRTDPAAPYDQATHALHFQWARAVQLRDVSVVWEEPSLPAWRSALCLEDACDLTLDGFTGRAAWPERGEPAVLLSRVSDALIRHARAPEGTRLFLKVTGRDSRGILLHANDLRRAGVMYQLDTGVPRGALAARDNLRPRR